MGDIIYSYGTSAYLNITNRCCCACTFCIRSQTDGLGSADSLWLDHEPSQEEINAAIDAFGLARYGEAVFCGYGEPTCALEKLIATARYIRTHYPSVRLRLNTNGLCDLINGPGTAEKLGTCLDAVSISLNAPDAEAYLAVTRPTFGAGSFEAMLAFAKECRKYIPDVKMTVVDTLSEKDIEASKALAQSLGIPLRVRHFTQG